MYTLISGSPKGNSSNSLYFLNIISSDLNNYNLFELKKGGYNEIIDSVNKSDVIVFAFPLYVDSPTSVILSFLDYIIDNDIRLNGKIIYNVINCGFREGEHNITASNIMKCWCKKVGAIYGSSIMIGAGEIIGKTKYKFISHKALKKLNEFSDIVKAKQIEGDIITTIDLINNRLYCHIANLSWNKKGKTHNLSEADLRIK